MKKWFILISVLILNISLISYALATDKKITELPEDTSPSTDDLLITVNDPGGVPANRKVTIANFIAAILGLDISNSTNLAVTAPIVLTGDTLSCPTCVIGPASSVDNALVRFNSTTGKIIQDYTSNAPTCGDTGTCTFANGVLISGGAFDQTDIVTFAANDDSPSVATGNLFKTNNSSTTIITAFDGAVNGQVFYVLIDDLYTTIDCTSSSIICNNNVDWTPACEGCALMHCFYDGTYSECLVGSKFDASAINSGLININRIPNLTDGYIWKGNVSNRPTETNSWTFSNFMFPNSTSLPATCTVGQGYFDSDATAGQNVYGCTATNTWTLQSGNGYVLHVLSGTAMTPVDDTTYYWGSVPVFTQTITIQRVYIPKAGTIKVAYIHWYGATAGSNENISMYIRLNDTSDTLIATVGDTNSAKLFSNTSLSIAVVQGDWISVKVVCPTWTTNPDNVNSGGYIYIE